MSVNEPTRQCPECQATLPAGELFCLTCGYMFKATSPLAPGSSPTPPPEASYDSPGYSLSHPTEDPGHVPARPRPDGTPRPRRPGASRRGPAGKAPLHRSRLVKPALLGLALVVLVVGGAALWVRYLDPGRCTGPLFDRHGVPGSVALPQGCSFQAHQVLHPEPDADVQGSFTYEQWIWTVTDSTPATLGTFFSRSLAASGWADMHTRSDKGTSLLSACQGNLYMSILSTTDPKSDVAGRTISVTPPPGGTVLDIGLYTANDAQEQAVFHASYCRNGSL